MFGYKKGKTSEKKELIRTGELSRSRRNCVKILDKKIKQQETNSKIKRLKKSLKDLSCVTKRYHSCTGENTTEVDYCDDKT